MFKKIVPLTLIFLSGCSVSAKNEIDSESPEKTVEVLQNLLGNEEMPEAELADMHFGLRESYTLDEHNFLFLDETGNEIEQINLLSVSKEEARAALELVGFPEAEIFEDMLNYTEEDMQDTVKTKEHFTNYEGVGIELKINESTKIPGSDFSLFDYDDPYNLMILFNEERFDSFKKH